MSRRPGWAAPSRTQSARSPSRSPGSTAAWESLRASATAAGGGWSTRTGGWPSQAARASGCTWSDGVLIEHLLHRSRALALGADEQLEVVRVRGGLQCFLHRHPAGLHVVEQGLVEGLHPVVAPLGDRLVEPARLVRVHDHVPDAPGHAQDLADGDAAIAVRGAHQALGDDALERAGEHGSRLDLL